MTPIPPYTPRGGSGGGSSVPELTMTYDRTTDVLTFTSTAVLTMDQVSTVRLYEAPVYDPGNWGPMELANDNNQLSATDEHTLVWANPFRDYFQQPQDLHWAYAFLNANGLNYNVPVAVNLGPAVEMRPFPVVADINLQGGTDEIVINGNYLSAADHIVLTGTNGFSLTITSPFSLSQQGQPSPTDYNVSQWGPPLIQFTSGYITEHVGETITHVQFLDADDVQLLGVDTGLPIT